MGYRKHALHQAKICCTWDAQVVKRSFYAVPNGHKVYGQIRQVDPLNKNRKIDKTMVVIVKEDVLKEISEENKNCKTFSKTYKNYNRLVVIVHLRALCMKPSFSTDILVITLLLMTGCACFNVLMCMCFNE